MPLVDNHKDIKKSKSIQVNLVTVLKSTMDIFSSNIPISTQENFNNLVNTEHLHLTKE